MISLRCSELDRTLECPGSIVLAPMVDAREPEDVTETGTALHYLSATEIIKTLGASGVLEPAPNPWPNLKASRWISDYYWRHVCDNCPADFSLEVEAGLSYEFDDFILSGHIDCVAVSPDGTQAIGWDLKTGYDAVDSADQNWQILGYIVALKRAYPALTKCTFFVIQPRNDEDEGFQRESKVVVDDLTGAMDGLVKRIQQAIASTDTLSTGRKQCTYCPASNQCPAIIQLREEMKMKLTAAALAGIKKTPDDATLADWAIAAKTLSKPIEDVMDLAKERINAQGNITAPDGTMITAKSSGGSYTVDDPVAFLKAFRGLAPTDASIAKCFKPRMGEIKDEIATVQNIPKTAKMGMSAETVFDATLRPLVTQGERVTLIFR